MQLHGYKLVKVIFKDTTRCTVQVTHFDSHLYKMSLGPLNFYVSWSVKMPLNSLSMEWHLMDLIYVCTISLMGHFPYLFITCNW